MIPGPMDFRGPIMGPLASEGAHRNDTEKSVCEDRRPFFFGGRIIILRHFLRLFWSLQNQKSVIFELAPGPSSALGAPDWLSMTAKG